MLQHHFISTSYQTLKKWHNYSKGICSHLTQVAAYATSGSSEAIHRQGRHDGTTLVSPLLTVQRPYTVPMAQQLRPRRFETRLDAATDDLIAQAADSLGESRSAFVVRAARQAAEKVVSPDGGITPGEALMVLLEGVDQTELAVCPLLRGLRNH